MCIRSSGKKYDKEKMRKWENEKMKNRFVRYVLMLLLCGVCHTVAFAYEYNRSTQTKSWGYQSTYQPTYQSTYQSASQKTFDPNVAEPTFRFRTTSTYINSSGDNDLGGQLSGLSGPRRMSMWDEEDDPIGVVPDPVTPVGDTPWCLMLLLVAGYIAFRSRRSADGHLAAD